MLQSFVGFSVSFRNKRLTFIRQMEADWWERYKIECFEYLLPTDKSRKSSDNIAVDDIVLIKYEGESKPGDYRWGNVTRADPDEDCHVHTVTVRYSLIKRPVQDGLYKGITRKEITAVVQRLSRIYYNGLTQLGLDVSPPPTSHSSYHQP